MQSFPFMSDFWCMLHVHSFPYLLVNINAHMFHNFAQLAYIFTVVSSLTCIDKTSPLRSMPIEFRRRLQALLVQSCHLGHLRHLGLGMSLGQLVHGPIWPNGPPKVAVWRFLILHRLKGYILQFEHSTVTVLMRTIYRFEQLDSSNFC